MGRTQVVSDPVDTLTRKCNTSPTPANRLARVGDEHEAVRLAAVGMLHVCFSLDSMEACSEAQIEMLRSCP
jgi:hypothetical protein